MNPDPQTVYRDAKGDPLLYVRTEQRPGASSPEHLFVKAYNRVCLQVWAKEVPEAAVLVIDAGGRRQANEERWLRLAAEHNVGILTSLLKRACAWLPGERASELRKAYREAQP
jgi:hypothetical protein